MAFEKLKELRCFPTLHDKLCAGVPIENIARWVQDEQGEYRDSQRAALVRMLFRYKASLPLTEVKAVVPSHIEKRLEQMKAGINEIDELEKLYLLQLTRINMSLAVEEKINFLNKETRKEVQLATDILRRSVQLKMELGILRRVPAELNLNASLKAENQEVLDNLDPDRRRKLGTVAAKLLEVMSEVSKTEASEAEEVPYEVISAGETSENVRETENMSDAGTDQAGSVGSALPGVSVAVRDPFGENARTK